MDPIERHEKKRDAWRRLRAQRQRAGMLRGRVIAISLLCFGLLWAVVFVQMATGNDPVLSAKSGATATATAKRAERHRARAAEAEAAAAEPVEPEESGEAEAEAEFEPEPEVLAEPEFQAEPEFEAAPEPEVEPEALSTGQS
jgi:cytoskeletal protein RodZ